MAEEHEKEPDIWSDKRILQCVDNHCNQGLPVHGNLCKPIWNKATNMEQSNSVP